MPEGKTATDLDGLVFEILDVKTLETRVGAFPDPYVAEARDAGHEFASIAYMPSRTFEADPLIQSGVDGTRRVVLADGHIADDLLAADPIAEYLAAALRGQRLERDTTHVVPVPIEAYVAEDLLERYAEDRDALAERDSAALESRIDDLVFAKYGIDDPADRERIRRYNTQHEEVRSIKPPDE